jgi:phosphoribosyl-AMP cyclohydrolase
MRELLERFRDAQTLLPAILQDGTSGEVLMLGWMNLAAFEATLTSKRATFWSRSRNKIWVKGETSGNYQEVISMNYDCDADAILIKVKSFGPVCHTGEASCFHNPIELPSR